MTPVLLAADHPLQAMGRRALLVGAVGLAVSLLCALADPVQSLRAYLVAYLFWAGAALGCLAILMINHLTGGAWGAAIRRPLESGAGTIPLMALFFLPIAAGVPHLYHWADPQAVAHDALLQHKRAYLNVPFFLVRAAAYFVAWTLAARTLRRWSLAQDASTDPRAAERMELLSRGGLVLLGLTMTFASVDWMMSLEPHWFSTIYGVVFMAGSVLTGFALVIPVTASLATVPSLHEVLGPGVFHDLGKLLLAFIMVWAYVSFSQFLIIWSGNLPEEIPWYMARLHGGWQWVALLLVVFHFALPFVVLLSRTLKRGPRRIATVALALAAIRFVELHWLVTPAFSPATMTFGWLDVAVALATVAGVGGVWLWFFVRRLAEGPVVPLHDEALAAEA